MCYVWGTGLWSDGRRVCSIYRPIYTYVVHRGVYVTYVVIYMNQLVLVCCVKFHGLLLLLVDMDIVFSLFTHSQDG